MPLTCVLFFPDFSTLSKKLGEIWQTVPEKEKNVRNEFSLNITGELLGKWK